MTFDLMSGNAVLVFTLLVLVVAIAGLVTGAVALRRAAAADRPAVKRTTRSRHQARPAHRRTLVAHH